jgi:hypothetical protein
MELIGRDNKEGADKCRQCVLYSKSHAKIAAYHEKDGEGNIEEVALIT